jgi:two-component system chemotaxis response regulator CheY
MSHTILVVDDAAFVRTRAARLLKDSGYDVIEAENGAEAVHKFTEHKPKAVLLDITMPIMDGVTALKEIKKLDPGARVAMVTAIGSQNTVIEALQAGAADFVVKPFQTDRLLASVAKLVA